MARATPPSRPAHAALAALLALASTGALAVAEEPAAPPARKPAAPPPERPGIRWEADVEAGLARAAREGRPVLVVVNALEEESATRMLAEQAYPSKAWGDASRPFVCFVANGNQHEEPVGPDGVPSCARFPGIRCSAHRDVLAWVLRRFSDDGESLTSPSHLILEPDGAVAYKKEFYTQEESPPFLDGWAARMAPRLAAKRAWIAREERLAALAKVPAERLEEEARAWLASGDGYAAPGLVAALELESGARKAAIRGALAATPQPSWPVLFDDVDAATEDPDADPEAALAWTRTALAVDPHLGAWAACRILARTREIKTRAALLATWSKDPAKPDVDGIPAEQRQLAAEALLLAGDASALAYFDPTTPKFPNVIRVRRPGFEGASPRRVLRAVAIGGVGTDDREADDSPEARAHWVSTFLDRVEPDSLAALSPDDLRAGADALRRARESGHVRMRLPSAVALVRIGDGAGVNDVLTALDDVVEGPDVHAALVRWHGSDLGPDAASWEPRLREATAAKEGK